MKNLKTNTLASEPLQKMAAHWRAANYLAVGQIYLFAILLVAGVLYFWGVLLSPAIGAGLMAASTVVVAINARMLKLK